MLDVFPSNLPVTVNIPEDGGLWLVKPWRWPEMNRILQLQEQGLSRLGSINNFIKGTRSESRNLVEVWIISRKRARSVYTHHLDDAVLGSRSCKV